MPDTYRIVFKNGEKQVLEVEATHVDGARSSDKGDSYTLRNGTRTVAIAPKARVLYIEKITGGE